MFLTRLQIDALPGIEPGFAFAPPSKGINIVIGPNAVGKSSLARALGYLLRDVANDDPPGLLLAAEFQSDSVRWSVRRNGSQILWTRDGESTARPSLPSGEQIGLYRLSVENLLASDQADKDLARQLRRQLRGGFDLQTPRIVLGARFARGEEKALRDATANLNRVAGDYSKLSREEARLSELSSQIEQATSAQQQAKRLELAISLQQSVAELANCEAALADFPKAIEALRGDEIGRVDTLENRKSQLVGELGRQNGQLDSQQRALQATGLQQARPTSDSMATVEQLLRQLGEKLIVWESAQTSLARADAEWRHAFEQLGGTNKAPKLGRESLHRIQEIVAPLLKARSRCEELEDRIKRVGSRPDNHEIERWQQGADALRDWLAARQRLESETEGNGRQVRVGVWLAFAASAIAAVAVGSLLIQSMGVAEGVDAVQGVIGGDGISAAERLRTIGRVDAVGEGTAPAAGVATAQGFTFALVAMFGALVAAGSSLLALLANKRQRSRGEAAENYAQSRFRQTGLAPPPEWTPNAAREHLRGPISKDLHTLLLQREQAAARPSLEIELAAARQSLRELESKRSALADKLGLDPTLPLLAYERFVGLCIRMDEARRAWEAQKAQCKQSAESIDHLAGSVAAFLNEWGQGTVAQWQSVAADTAKDQQSNRNDGKTFLTALQSAFNALRARLDAANDAIVAIAGAQTEVQSLQRQIAEADQEIETIYGRVGLHCGQRGELAALVDRLDDWRGARIAREQARGSERLLREQLRDHPNLTKLADLGSTDELQANLKLARRNGEKFTELIEQRSSIQTKLRAAGADGALEKAIAAEAGARESLADKRDEAYLSCVTNHLLDEVETEFHSEHEPDVLRRAKALFAQATGYEFALELRPDDSFVARDNKQGLLREVVRLSSGTRMQLLLALRLAWTEAREQGGETLPLFLDEALTTSDEGRFKVIAESLERLAEVQNRQIFYLAARQHEAALWRQATGKVPPVVNLAEVRFAQHGQTPTEYQIDTPPALPAPGSRTAAEYAALLHVPRIDPRLPAETLHLFHLLRDDLNLLHHLIDRWRIQSLGQLENLLASNALASAMPEQSNQHRLSQRCVAFRAWVELWRQGRGKPVGRGTLEQSGAVSGTFIDAASKLADEVDGDARNLVQALRDGALKGFRSGKTNDLETWLMEQGFLDERPVRTTEELHRLTLQQLAPKTIADVNDINEVVGWFCH